MARILSARNGMNGDLAAALEGLGIEGEGDESMVDDQEPVSSELDQEHAELAEAAADVEEAHEVIEELEGSAEGLESIALMLEGTLAEGGLTPQAAAFMNVAVESHTARLGLKRSIVPSMESFGGDTSRAQATQISLESIGETINKIWEAIKKAYFAVVNAVKAFFDRLFNVAPRVKAKAEALKKKLEGLKGTPQGKIKLGSHAGRIAVNGKISAPGAVVKLIHGITEAHGADVPVIDKSWFKTSELDTAEKKSAFVKKMVEIAKGEQKPVFGIQEPYKSEGNAKSFKTEVLPGNQIFVIHYEAPKPEDSPATAVSRASAGFTLTRQGAEKATAVKDGLELTPLTESEMHEYLADVIKMAETCIAAKGRVKEMTEGGEKILEKLKAGLDGDKFDESVVAAYLRSAGKGVSNAAKAPYEIAKYGAEVMQSYLVVVENSIKAHGEKKKAA